VNGSVVVDASLAIKWVLTEPYTVEAVTLLTEWSQRQTSPLVPGWFACEVANVLYRRMLAGSLTLANAKLGVENLMAAVTVLDVEPATATRAVEIADLLGQQATYDAQYAALAEHESCELWTADERFWRAAQPHFSWVRWIGQYIAQP
jgi:predicted nucleic acid-binding protein